MKTIFRIFCCISWGLWAKEPADFSLNTLPPPPNLSGRIAYFCLIIFVLLLSAPFV